MVKGGGYVKGNYIKNTSFKKVNEEQARQEMRRVMNIHRKMHTPSLWSTASQFMINKKGPLYIEHLKKGNLCFYWKATTQ